MADQTDVANSLVALIAGIAYPNGSAQPSAAPANAAVKTYQGWPNPVELDSDILAKKIHASVWPTPTERQVEQHSMEWQQASIATATIAMAVNGTQVTVSGTGGASQNASILVDGASYVYAVQANDTPTSIATALAALISADRSASSTGAVLMIPNSRSITARVGVIGTNIREVARMEKVFQVSIWANSPASRDPFASLIDSTLRGMLRMTMVDGSLANIRYKGSIQRDNEQKNGIYRRDILYAVEYSVTQTITATQVVAESFSFTDISPIDGTTIKQTTVNL
jgi:hypothetical protein